MKLFVRNLSWDTNDDTLRDAFSRFGEVTEARVATDRETGKSRGFAFITFPNDAEAQAAITAMDEVVLDGRTIRVAESENQGGGRGGGRPPRKDGGSREAPREPIIHRR